MKIDKNALFEGTQEIAVWGAGFIGATTAMAFASEGVKVTCYDISERAVEGINLGKVEVTNLEFWYGATMAEFVQKGLVKATTDWEELGSDRIVAHFIAVPTERNGQPWDGALIETLEKLKGINPPLVIIESTLTPGKIDSLDVSSIRLGISPRRDWFHSPEKNLKNLARVYAGLTPDISNDMQAVLSIVCDHLIRASSHRVAELVKSVENTLLHIPAVFATQLAHAYPHLDIAEVLDLAATHWRIPRYYPSLGTGGYCIPVSSQYVKLGAERPEYLTILDAAIASDAEEPFFIARRISERVRGKVGVLGVSYKGDLKVHTLSPAVRIIRHLLSQPHIDLRVNDPYYSPEEIQSNFGAETFDYNAPLDEFEALIVVTDHKAYSRMPLRRLHSELKEGTIVVDNYGIWQRHREALRQAGIDYHRVGDSGWVLDSEPARI